MAIKPSYIWEHFDVSPSDPSHANAGATTIS